MSKFEWFITPNNNSSNVIANTTGTNKLYFIISKTIKLGSYDVIYEYYRFYRSYALVFTKEQGRIDQFTILYIFIIIILVDHLFHLLHGSWCME